jgi:hypothetical protein
MVPADFLFLLFVGSWGVAETAVAFTLVSVCLAGSASDSGAEKPVAKRQKKANTNQSSIVGKSIITRPFSGRSSVSVFD